VHVAAERSRAGEVNPDELVAEQPADALDERREIVG
jgi:hypothetical protein